MSFLLLELAKQTQMADLDGDRVAGLRRAMGCDGCQYDSGRGSDCPCTHEIGWSPLHGGIKCANRRGKADLS